MQVTVESQSAVKKILHIEIPENDVNRELDAAYNQLKKTAKVKGFRPGKVPRSVLERMFGKNVGADVTSRLIQESFVDAVKDTELAIIGQPTIDPTPLVKNEPYKYDATVEIKPEIDDIEFKGLKLKKTIYNVEDTEIDGQLKMLQKNLAQTKPIEEKRGLQVDDMALIDFEGLRDGEPFEPTQKTENFTLKIGSGKIIKAFDDQLIGMQAEEVKEFDIQFPSDFSDTKLADQLIHFIVTLKEIRQEILPEIDDELAKKMGNYDTLDALREEIRNNVQSGYDRRVDQELNEQIFEQLLAKSEFEVPEALIQFELDGLLDEAARAFEMRGLTKEQFELTRNELSEKYQDTAKKQAKRHLILGKLIEQEKLEISDQEMDDGYLDLAQSFQQPLENIKKFYVENADKVEFFKNALLEKKMIKLIIDNSEIEEVAPEEAAEKE